MLFDRNFLGFPSDFFASGSDAQSYPRYNIVRYDDGGYRVELALAGFGKDDLEVYVDENVLHIVGKANASESEGLYVHKGISSKGFHQRFSLSSQLEVQDGDYADGLLTVELAEKPKKDTRKLLKLK